MGRIDHALDGTIPHYRQIKRGMATVRQEKPKVKRKGQTLTEYNQSGEKPVIKARVGINQVARKLHEYEKTGLTPREVADLIVQAENLEAKIKKLEDWN